MLAGILPFFLGGIEVSATAGELPVPSADCSEWGWSDYDVVVGHELNYSYQMDSRYGYINRDTANDTIVLYDKFKYFYCELGDGIGGEVDSPGWSSDSQIYNVYYVGIAEE